MKADVIIVGAGPVGCVLAERFSNILNLKVLIIEKRNHIAGNCFDTKNSKGLLYHKYGPHYLRFKNKKTFDYVSKFTKWIPGNYIVKSIVKNKHYTIPINLDTLEKFFNVKFKSNKEAIDFINKKRFKISNPKNSEEFVLSKLGKEIYDAFYKNYTKKQWGMDPKKLSKEITGRIPIRMDRSEHYVNEKLRYMPKNGYTELFKKMTNNKNITFLLNTDYFKVKNKFKANYFTIYTGIPDRYFNYKFGKLKWRSLIFKFKTFKKKFIQKNVQYNFPNEFKFTRKVEIKHVTKQRSNYTVISKEYPTGKGEPYYPIMDKSNIKMFKKYEKLMNSLSKKNIYFEGRLARYKYFNTDQVIEKALDLFNLLKFKYRKK